MDLGTKDRPSERAVPYPFFGNRTLSPEGESARLRALQTVPIAPVGSDDMLTLQDFSASLRKAMAEMQQIEKQAFAEACCLRESALNNRRTV